MSTRQRFYRRKWFLWPVGIVGGAMVVTLLVFNLSPRPGAYLIRSLFEDDSAKVKEALEAHAPEGVVSIANEQYRPDDGDAMLDVYFPEGSDRDGVQLPTIVWTHGGAWISGSKDDVVPYFQLIAAEGYTVVALDYSLGPHKTYPTAVHQINDALAYIEDNAARFRIDPETIFLAGDSAGSQLSGQMGALITNPEYASELGITPALDPAQVKGVILNCGIYDMQVFLDKGKGIPTLGQGILGWGVGITTWAYTGSRDRNPETNTALAEMSSIDHATAAYPPVFITGGNDDPLTDSQSKPFAEVLEKLGVEVTTLFYPADHEPKLGHEYQFNLDNADGQDALAAILAFVRNHVD